MPERLTECLIRRGQLTKRRADEALERQVLMGGALDTSLLELGHATEDALVEGMAAAYGLATASPRHARAERDERALRSFPEQWAEKHMLAPLSFDEANNTLSVLTPAPADVNMIVRLGDLLDLTIRPLLAPEFRVQERLAFLYGIDPPERFATLIASHGAGATEQTESEPPPVEAKAEPAAPEPEAPAPAEPIVQPPPPAEKKSDALTFGEAVSQLRNAADRDEIVRTTLLYAVRDLEHASVFINHDDTLEGWLGYGPGGESVPGLKLRRGPNSAFSVVLETGAHYLGPLPSDDEHEQFLTRLGRPHPRAILIVPIRIKNRTVALLYGENGARPIAPRIAADLMLFMTHVQVALADLLVRRKAETLSQLTRADDPTEPKQPQMYEASLVSDEATNEANDDSVDDIDVDIIDPEPDPTQPIAVPGNGAMQHGAMPDVPIETPVEASESWEPVDVNGLDELSKELDETIAAAQAAMQPQSEPLVRPPPPNPDPFEGGVLVPTGDLEQGLLDELDELEDQLTSGSAFEPEPAAESTPPVDDTVPTPTVVPPPGFEPPAALQAPPAPEPMVAPPEASTSDLDDGWESVEVDDGWDSEGDAPKLSAIRTSIVEDATVPDLSAEAWLRASSDTTRARPLPPEVMERAAMPDAAEPVPLTRITVGQREIDANGIVEVNGVSDHRSEGFEEPVPLTKRSEKPIDAEAVDLDAEEPVPLTKLSTSQALAAEPIPLNLSEAPNPFAYDEEVERTPDGVAVHQVVDAMGRMVPTEPSLPPPAPVVDPTKAVAKPWESELKGHVDRLGSANEEERLAAIESLIKVGPTALDKICERFPGPLNVDPFSPDATNLPPFAKCGGLLNVLERYGRDAHEHVVRRLDAPDPLVRFFAIYFYSAVFVPEAVPRLIQRLHDEESRICMLAARTLFSYREHPDFAQVLEHLHGRLGATSVTARRHAAYLIGLFRDVTAVPKLIDVLDQKDRGMIDVAEDALAEIAKQRFNGSARKWRTWWSKNESKSRIEWLIDGLSTKDNVLRRSAAEELRAVTGMDMGFDEDGPKREREEAKQRWIAWWEQQR